MDLFRNLLSKSRQLLFCVGKKTQEQHISTNNINNKSNILFKRKFDHVENKYKNDQQPELKRIQIVQYDTDSYVFKSKQVARKILEHIVETDTVKILSNPIPTNFTKKTHNSIQLPNRLTREQIAKNNGTFYLSKDATYNFYSNVEETLSEPSNEPTTISNNEKEEAVEKVASIVTDTDEFKISNQKISIFTSDGLDYEIIYNEEPITSSTITTTKTINSLPIESNDENSNNNNNNNESNSILNNQVNNINNNINITSSEDESNYGYEMEDDEKDEEDSDEEDKCVKRIKLIQKEVSMNLWKSKFALIDHQVNDIEGDMEKYKELQNYEKEKNKSQNNNKKKRSQCSQITIDSNDDE